MHAQAVTGEMARGDAHPARLARRAVGRRRARDARPHPGRGERLGAAGYGFFLVAEWVGVIRGGPPERTINLSRTTRSAPRCVAPRWR
jgi:hypothetical protein